MAKGHSCLKLAKTSVLDHVVGRHLVATWGPLSILGIWIPIAPYLPPTQWVELVHVIHRRKAKISSSSNWELSGICSKSLCRSILLVGLQGFLYWIITIPNILGR